MNEQTVSEAVSTIAELQRDITIMQDGLKDKIKDITLNLVAEGMTKAECKALIKVAKQKAKDAAAKLREETDIVQQILDMVR